MSDNTITITLDDVLGPDGLEGAWHAMVDRLADKAEGKFLHSDAGKNFHAVVVNAINQAVERRVAEEIEARISAPIQQTDSYGNPKGEPTTFVEMIGKAVEGAMTEKVTLGGRPDRHGSMTLFDHALNRLAIAELGKAVKAEAAKVNTAAKAAVSKEIAKHIASVLKS